MTKLLLLSLLTGFGVLASLTGTPFIGLAIYYLYAVLRPQWLWQWDLPVDVPWSFYVAVAAIVGSFLSKGGDWAGSEKRQRVASPRLALAHWAFFAFAGWIVVTYFTAENRDVAREAFTEYVKIFVMYAVATVVVASVRHLWILYLTVTGALCYIASDMNQIYFFQGYLFVYRLGFGGLDNNGAALMLAMGVPLCLFAWDGLRHWSRWGFLLMIPVIVHAVLTSYSRGAMLALVACIPVYFLRCTRKWQLTAMMLCIAAMIPFLAGKEIQDRFFSVEKFNEDDSAASRLTSWGIAWKMANERPFLGFGVRNSNLHTFSYGADMDGRTIHSQYLQIAADSGLMAMVLYLAALAMFLRAVNASRKEMAGRDDPEARRTVLIANGVESAMIIFCIGGVFLSLENFELPYLMMLMGAQLWSVTLAAKQRQAFDPWLEVRNQALRESFPDRPSHP